MIYIYTIFIVCWRCKKVVNGFKLLAHIEVTTVSLLTTESSGAYLLKLIYYVFWMFKGIVNLAPEFLPIAVIVVVNKVPGIVDENKVSIVVPVNVNDVPTAVKDKVVPEVWFRLLLSIS